MILNFKRSVVALVGACANDLGSDRRFVIRIFTYIRIDSDMIDAFKWPKLRKRYWAKLLSPSGYSSQ